MLSTYTILISFIGSKSVFQEAPIAALVVEWFFKDKGELGPCPEIKVKELTQFLLSSNYVPFAWGIKKNTIVRLDASNYGQDWFSSAIIWLRRDSLPDYLSTRDIITLRYKEERMFS